MFGISKPRADILVRTFGADRTGNARTLERASLLKQLRARRKGVAFSEEVDRRQLVMATLRQARITGIRVPGAPDVRSTRLCVRTRRGLGKLEM